MFWSEWNKEQKERIRHIARLEEVEKRLEARIEELKKEHDIEYAKILHSCSSDVDFQALRPFSIGRKHVKDREYYTVFNYLLGNEIHQLNLFTSIEQHNELAEKFRAYVESKKG